MAGPRPGRPADRPRVYELYLRPLASLPEIETRLRLSSPVVALTRQGRDRLKNTGREAAPFVLRYLAGGDEREMLAGGVIDASGTLGRPNPAGAGGLAALGERSLGERIFYGMPDLLGRDRGRYAGRRILVIGGGHSAFGVLIAAARLRQEAPGTEIFWALRQPSLAGALRGGENDELAERGRLDTQLAAQVAAGEIAMRTGFQVERFTPTPEGIVAAGGGQSMAAVDEVVVATGYRPDLSLLAELRLELDPATESPRRLGPLIDPNFHSCGTVPPHGAEELRHPEDGLYVVGMKSYGRAPTFLLRTGYEQVRSVAAALAGDWDSARRVELQLPATGVCSSQRRDRGPAVLGGYREACCGGPPPESDAACCAADAAAKSAGAQGCGCSC